MFRAVRPPESYSLALPPGDQAIQVLQDATRLILKRLCESPPGSLVGKSNVVEPVNAMREPPQPEV